MVFSYITQYKHVVKLHPNLNEIILYYDSSGVFIF